MQKSFRDSVYEITKCIPWGKVAIYGQIAAMAGSPGAARSVGMFMKHNPDMSKIPCHRVVGAEGKLTGYSAKEGIKTKREMLQQEGVVFVGDKVNLLISKWKPGV
jgi:O-6-methylguanine DNA methyltransferase